MDKWTPAAEGKALRAVADPEAARGAPGADRRWCRTSTSRPAEAPKAKAQAIMRAPARCGCPACIRSAPRAPTCRRRQDHRSDRGRHARPRHPAALAGDRRRRLHERGRRLRHRLRLQLRQHAVVAHADHAAADADRPARRVRAAVRRRAQRRRARAGSSPRIRAFSTRSSARSGSCSGRLGAADSGARRANTSTACARSSGACADDGGARRSSTSALPDAGRRAGSPTTSTSG